MFENAKRMVNGVIMLWAALLFVLRYSYIFVYGILLLIGSHVLTYMIPQLKTFLIEEAFSASTPLAMENLFSMDGLMALLGVYLFFCMVSFVEIAVIKYIMAILNQDVSTTKKRDSFYRAAKQIIPIMIWSAIVSSAFIAGLFIAAPWIYAVLIPFACATFFVPALIAEEKLAWSNMVLESVRILRDYWPECVGFIIVPIAIYWGWYALIYPALYPAELAIKGYSIVAWHIFGAIVSEPIFKTILVQAAHRKNVGSEFAPYLDAR